MKYLKYNTQLMSDSELWQAVLTPIESKMPEKLRQFIEACQAEFSARKIKLSPITK